VAGTSIIATDTVAAKSMAWLGKGRSQSIRPNRHLVMPVPPNDPLAQKSAVALPDIPGLSVRIEGAVHAVQ
jgi:hypothetical protein